MRELGILLCALILAGCSQGEVPDRRIGPLQAFEAAREALREKDARGFYDALGKKSAMFLLRNTVLICISSNGPEAANLRLHPNPDCLTVMRKFGWPEGSLEPLNTEELWKELWRIRQPREFAAALDTSIRKSGNGTSFVWSHLEPVTIQSIMTSGNEAKAIVVWSEEQRELTFVRDETGWRVETIPSDVLELLYREPPNYEIKRTPDVALRTNHH